MKIDPGSLVIEEVKIRGYLLSPRRRNDKSGFLGLGGYTAGNWKDLEEDIRRAAAGVEAAPKGANPFGELFETAITLPGRGGSSLCVRAIWFRPKETDRFRLVTIVPDKEAAR